MFKSLLLAALVLFSSCAATPAAPLPISKIVSNVEMSMVRITHALGTDKEYTCTGFIIDAARGWVLTAQHCVVDDFENQLLEEVEVNGITSPVIKTSDTLALIKVPAMMGPPLDLRKGKLNRGDVAIGIGFGFGSETVVVRHVSDPKKGFTDSDLQDIILDGPLVPGMSGGPIVDENGDVIGVSQQNSPMFLLSRACGVDEIKEFLSSK